MHLKGQFFSDMGFSPCGTVLTPTHFSQTLPLMERKRSLKQTLM